MKINSNIGIVIFLFDSSRYVGGLCGVFSHNDILNVC